MTAKHRLLLGTWRSDQRRTLKTCHHYHGLVGAKKRKFAALFGKLELRYTRRFVYHTLRDFKYRERYDVVAEDETSIVIRVHSDGIKKKLDKVLLADLEEFPQSKLHQIHFVLRRGHQFYWIGQGRFCEWFRKLEGMSRAVPKTHRR